jgi:hypothetical protein
MPPEEFDAATRTSVSFRLSGEWLHPARLGFLTARRHRFTGVCLRPIADDGPVACAVGAARQSAAGGPCWERRFEQRFELDVVASLLELLVPCGFDLVAVGDRVADEVTAFFG